MFDGVIVPLAVASLKVMSMYMNIRLVNKLRDTYERRFYLDPFKSIFV